MTLQVQFAGSGPEADAAWEWLRGQAGDRTERAVGELPEPGGAAVCWWHTDRPLAAAVPETLRAWVAGGGRLLLTLAAADAAHRLGLDPVAPDDSRAGVWRHADDELWFDREFEPWSHRRGFAGFGPHPLFAGFTGGSGAYTWEPADGEPYVWRAYVGTRPAGRVVACERSYLSVNPRRVVAWEYAVDRGGVLCLGAFVHLAAQDPALRPQLEQLLRNALFGEAIPHLERGTARCWPGLGVAVQHDESLVLPPPPNLGGALPPLDDPLAVESRASEDQPWQLAGRRLLAIGGERSGLREVWSHPHRVLAGLGISIGGETPVVQDATVAPDAVARHLVTRHDTVEECAFVALEHPMLVLEFRGERMRRSRNLPAGAAIELRWDTDLRRMWPYPAGAWGDLRYRFAPQVLVVADSDEQVLAAVVTSRPVAWDVRPVVGRAAVACRLATTLDEPLRVSVIGAAGRSDLTRVLRALARGGLESLVRERLRRTRERHEAWAVLTSPDPRLDAALEWAKARLDGFLADTPGVGRSLVAGHGPSRPGWHDGRPGYAWYFGRDACWTAPALLAAGESAPVRQTLRFLLGAQEISGKVPHEVTTSGLAHYDAADSTPLVLLLAAQYARWTGDLDFLSDCWPALERAYRFCLGTDRDGDGLIENRGVGHGWVESGPLAGAVVSLYLAAVWEAALRDLAPVARALGRPELARDMEGRAGKAREAISLRFRTDDGYAAGLRETGALQLDRTALLAVPLLLGAVDPSAATSWFDWVASTDATAAWGVRLLGRSHPGYRARGYHSGAVWPLFTGWVALAEYRCHRPGAGFEHLVMNAALPFVHGAGQFPEVLDGDDGSPAGVCPSQAWSAAMLVTPLLEGLLGIIPDALRGAVIVRPHLPHTWHRLAVRNLRVARTAFDVRFAQRGGQWVADLRRTAGPALHVTLDLPLPPARAAASAAVDGTAVVPRLAVVHGCRHAAVSFELRAEHTVTVEHAPEA